MKPILVLLLALLCAKVAHTQTRKNYKFQVIDSAINQKMEYATIILTRASDSIMVNSCRTNIEGFCMLSIPDSGHFIIRVIYPGYIDFAERIDQTKLNSNEPYIIPIKQITHYLKEVIVKNVIAKMRLRGDTIEFRADSFLTDKNASVEDLLKRLPGISVDRNGNLSAFGRPVEKLMIDGEEYFSEDPTLVTRSLRSNIIEKVQVFDKATDQAAFSKVKDGNTAKTINLELKADKKKGYFGKIKAGTNFGSYYDNQVMINRFNGDQKLAIFLIHSNLGETGLSWNDTRTYSDFALTSKESVGFGSPQPSSLDIWDGNFQNRGLSYVLTGGVHYNDKLSNSISSNLNYKYNNLHLNLLSTNQQQFRLNNIFYSNYQSTITNNRANTHRGIIKTTVKLSNSSNLIFGVDLSNNTKAINNNTTSSLFADTISKLNSQQRSLVANGNDRTFNINLLWQKRINTNVTFSISSKLLNNWNRFNGFITANDSLFRNNMLNKDSLTNQLKNDSNENVSANTKAILTVVLNPLSTFAFTTNYTFNKSQSTLSSFNKMPNGDYSRKDSLYSGIYDFSGHNTSLGLTYIFANTKIISTTTIETGISSINQMYQKENPFLQKRFLFFPSTNLTYKFKSQHSIIFDYSGATILPQLNQLQPILTNIDPLNQLVGNPALSPAFRNSFFISYINFNSSKQKNFSFEGSYSFDINGFSTSDNIDEFGKRTYSLINLPRNKRVSIYSSYSKSMFSKLIELNIIARVNGGENSKILNGLTILTRSINYGLTINPSIYQQDKFSTELKTSLELNSVKSLSPNIEKDQYLNFVFQPAVSVNLQKFTVLKMDWFVTKYPTNRIYGNAQSISLLNLSITHSIFKQRSFSFQFYAKNILNNDTGLSRYVNNNYSTQTTYNTIGRYFMLSINYLFSQTSKSQTK